MTPIDNGPRRIVAILVGLAAAAGGGFYWYQNRTPEIPQKIPGVVSTSQPPAELPPSPAIQHPVPDPVADDGEEATVPLPGLQESDPLALENLLTLFADPAIAALIRPEFVIPRIVSTIDNLPRDRLNTHAMPLKPVPGAFVITANGDEVFIGDENAARYTPYVDAFVAVDSAELVTRYRRLYPLFQRAYVELGDPNAYFNDRLIAVIDHMLQSPEATPPIALVKPRSNWEYADPELQSQSIGHRMMLRMGSAHAARVKAKLVELRAALIAG